MIKPNRFAVAITGLLLSATIASAQGTLTEADIINSLVETGPAMQAAGFDVAAIQKALFERIQVEGTESAARPMPVLPAVMDALALFGPQIKAAGVRVENHLPGNADILVIGDTVRLGQVLVNLLSNAVDAMADAADKTLRISVEEDGEAVLIKVTDTGTGIPPDVLPHVFDPFFTTKESGKGLGLGLPISYGIVRDFGGALTAVSNPQGGATFTVTLRRSRAAHAA